MKVKVFCASRGDLLETFINDWLTENTDVMIKHTEMTALHGDIRDTFCILVFYDLYKEKEEV